MLPRAFIACHRCQASQRLSLLRFDQGCLRCGLDGWNLVVEVVLCLHHFLVCGSRGLGLEHALLLLLLDVWEDLRVGYLTSFFDPRLSKLSIDLRYVPANLLTGLHLASLLVDVSWTDLPNQVLVRNLASHLQDVVLLPLKALVWRYIVEIQVGYIPHILVEVGFAEFDMVVDGQVVLCV